MSDPHLDARPDARPRRADRRVPWTRIGIAAGVGLVGTLVALAVALPLLVLGSLTALGLVGLLGYRLARRTWDAGTVVPQRPAPSTVEATAEGHRAAARQRHAATGRVVASGLLGPGFTRSDG